MVRKGESIGLFEKCCPLPNTASITNATTINATRQAAVKDQTKHTVRSVARIGLALITFLSSRNRLTFVCIPSPYPSILPSLGKVQFGRIVLDRLCTLTKYSGHP